MNLQVLIVDDSKLARMAIGRALTRLYPGWTKLEASNADEALELARAESVDIALLDFNMPGRDGLQLAAELQQVAPNVVIALISANNQNEVVAQTRSLGATFLSKPVTEPALAEFLTLTLQRKGGRVTPRTTTPLNDLQIDALVELVNIGVSRAATSLRELVNQQVLLSVPNVALVSRPDAIEIIGRTEAKQLVAVHQVFEGDITGRALLIFPETNSLELVRAVTGGELPLEDIIELEQEALAETGNIILNGCLATIANLLHRNLKMSLPEILRGRGQDLFNLAPPPEAGDVVLFLYINFAVRERDIRGYIAMLMDMPSLEALRGLLDEFIERVAGETAPETDGPG